MNTAAEIREELFSVFPSVDPDDFDVDPNIVMRDFIRPARVSKSFMAYLVKMDRVGDQFLSISNKEESDKLFVLDALAQFSNFLRTLVSRLDSWNGDKTLFDCINKMMIHLPIMQLLYTAKFIELHIPGYLEKLFSDETEDSICLTDRLSVTFKAFRLTKIFSQDNFLFISTTLKAISHVQK